MHLKRLELMGFKSFPEKIRLEFHEGITAVVGPNGSGKSNIADAVRWVLGEQSAKSLRGAKMEDIIFSGTENRRPVGFAEVSMVMDNLDHRLALDFTEIKVTRRVYRSGESEYLINEAACRLRDIHELFMDTGIGKEGYSIIGQGRIEEILSSRSEDRRLLFEEAAGVVKYKNRKQEAQNKLERERQNLVRVNDILTEMEERLEPLRVQSEAALRYLNLRDRLKLLQINLFLLEVDRIREQMDRFDQTTADIRAQLEDEKLAQAGIEARGTEWKEKARDADEKLRAANDALMDIRTAIEQRESDIKIAGEKGKHLFADAKRLQTELQKKDDLAKSKKEDLRSEEERQAALARQISEKSEIVSQKQEALEEFSEWMAERERTIDQLNAEIIKRIEASAEAKSDKQRAEDNYEKLEQQKERLNEDLRVVEVEINERSARQGMLRGALDGIEDSFEKQELCIDRYKREVELLQARQKDVLAQIEPLEKSLRENESRLTALSELERDYEGYNKSVKAILKHKKETGRFEGVCGAVAELCEAAIEYETAVEIALGGAVQNIVTRTEDDAKQAIEYLKMTRAGRATFLPLTAIKARSMGDAKAQVMKEPGVKGVAKELIRYAPEYENIFANLLGNVVVIDTIGHAVSVFKKYKYAFKIVTLDGELLSPGGAMTGGSISQRSAQLFSRGREMKALRVKIESGRKEYDALNHQAEDLARKSNATQEEIERARQKTQSLAIEKNTLIGQMEQTEAELSRLLEKVKAAEEEDRRIMAQIMETNVSIRRHNQTLCNMEEEADRFKREMEDYQSVLSNDRSGREERLREITDLKVEMAGLEQNAKASEENILRLRRETEDVETELVQLHEELEQNLREEQNERERLGMFSAQRDRLLVELDEKREDIHQIDVLKEEIRKKNDELESLEREKTELLVRLTNELTRLEVNREQTEVNNRQLYDRIWDEYQLTYQLALEYPRLEQSAAELQKEEKQVRNEMSAMGDVNVGAMEEYRTVDSRYRFMTVQRDDILAAEEKLNEIISELTRLMERQFREQFALISENFGVVFKEMFGGGTAVLRLSDESHILESGIDIIAQPPGKTLQSMSLLSGGERALTATALLFGILRMKPSPFCVLDEIEAALDDANVNRFAQFLKSFEGTQFIVITHRKGTMEAADVLYGVTMQEQGISKLVSVKFAEGEQAV